MSCKIARTRCKSVQPTPDQGGSSLKSRWMNVEDVARYLSLSTGAVYNMVYRGSLPANPIGRRLRFDIRVIDSLLENSKKRSHYGH
jgi:excisionase family DNA binding protein